MFINAIVNFLIIGFCVFWVVRAMSRFVAREKAVAPPAPAPSEILLEQIRDTLRERLPIPPLQRDTPL